MFCVDIINEYLHKLQKNERTHEDLVFFLKMSLKLKPQRLRASVI